MMRFSARHDPQVTAPPALLAELERDLPAAAQAIRELGGIEPYLATR